MGKTNEELKSEIVLTEQEKQIIESQRRDLELLQIFRTEYEALVHKTGFAWAVDSNSPLNNIQLGIGKVVK